MLQDHTPHRKYFLINHIGNWKIGIYFFLSISPWWIDIITYTTHGLIQVLYRWKYFFLSLSQMHDPITYISSFLLRMSSNRTIYHWFVPIRKLIFHTNIAILVANTFVVCYISKSLTTWYKSWLYTSYLVTKTYKQTNMQYLRGFMTNYM